jgi:flagellar hook-length control protein FliK
MMQFNPLFLNDIKGSQSPNNNSGKLQKNQYLFSDIIKVVMEDGVSEENLTKLSLNDQTEEAEIIGGSFMQVSEQLQNIPITDAESEEMKIQLADILPEDMAKLLTTDDVEINNSQIVSYIGKEQMQGDLQNFLTGLVGEKVFEQHVTNNSGVLLKLEDTKSSVNIEITKEISKNSTENKTMVHALIVPQKSKLQLLTQQNSLLNELKPNSYLNNVIDTTKLKKLEKEINNSSIVKNITSTNNNNTQTTKPTLSVFSFNIDSNVESASSLSEKLKVLVKKNENELEKIIKSTKHLKTESNVKINNNEITSEITENNKTNSKIKNGEKNLSNVNKRNDNSIKRQKDFNISKITIIKKQSSIDYQEITNNKNNHENIKISSNVFNTISKDKTININENTKATGEKINRDILENQKLSKEIKNNLQVEHRIKSQEIPKANAEKEQTAKGEIINLSKSAEKTPKKIDNINTQGKEVPKNKTENSTVSRDNNFETKIETQVKEKSNNLTTNENITNKNTTQSVSKDIPKTTVEMQENNKDVVVSEKSKATEILHRENDVNKKNNNEVQFPKQNDSIKSSKEYNANAIKKEQDDISSGNKNLSATNQIIVEKAVKNLVPNKKVSVKVKKVVKSVNNKNEQESNISTEIRLEQKDEQLENNLNQNNSKDLQNLKNPDLETHTKKKFDPAFHHIMQKEQNIKINEASITPQEIRQQNSERIVKSIEVIKEISRFISTQKKGSLSFTINPEHLGHLKITLESNNHLINAHIQVENEQAKLLVEKNLNELHTQLQESGVELNSLNISMGYSSKQEKSFQQKSKQKIDYSDSTIEEINNKKNETKSLGYNTYEYLA